jgi:hypothetical protein
LHERRIGGALDWRLDRVVAQSGVEPHNISACALLRAGVQPLYNDLMGRDFKDTSEAAKRKIVRETAAALTYTKSAREDSHVSRSRRHQHE